MASKLPNYLRMHRKRLDLTQDEVAFLLGSKSGTRVSRYERYSCLPDLRTAMALEVIFARPLRVLFEGVYEEVQEATERRARQLARKRLAKDARKQGKRSGKKGRKAPDRRS